MRSSKPNFQGVVDLGLRDVGVKNESRRLAAHLVKTFAALFALVVLFAVAFCFIAIEASPNHWVLIPFSLASIAGLVLLMFRALKQSPPVVVKVNAEGTHFAIWFLMVPPLLLLVQAAVLRDPLVIPLIVSSLIFPVILWRRRRRLPEALGRLRALLAANESVLGDGIGIARGARRQRDAFRLVAVTDRRVLVGTAGRSAERFLVVDAPHRDVTGFGIEWKYGGRFGVLSLTVPALDGSPSETQVICSIAPANLLSIVRALQSQGVPADDPAVVAEAELAWEEAQQAVEPQRQRLLDPAAMSTPAFDRGLWVLVAVSAVNFYLHPFVGFGIVLVLAALCVVCGYASGTKSSLAYIVPLNLLVAPAFFFEDAGDVIVAMLVLSVVAAIGLAAGSTLRAGPAPASARPAARGTLRYAVSGLSLIRISGVLLAIMLSLVGIASAAGFELSTLRPGADQVTEKRVPVDGRSNLTGNAASLTYSDGPGLSEFITDEHWDGGPNDGARWELRSSLTHGDDVISLAHYIFLDPRLDTPGAVAEFVADKDDEHSQIAGFRVTHTERVVDGRKGYVWTHRGRRGYWHYVIWFPQPVHTIRVECVARKQADRFKRLCAEATASLEFR